MRGSGIKPVFNSILVTLHTLFKSESITVHYCTAASRLQRPDIDTDTVVPDIKHIRRLEEHLKADEIYYTPLVSSLFNTSRSNIAIGSDARFHET